MEKYLKEAEDALRGCGYNLPIAWALGFILDYGPSLKIEYRSVGIDRMIKEIEDDIEDWSNWQVCTRT